MTYIDYINEFNRRIKEDSLPDKAIILYYAMLDMFNRRGWPRWAGVDTLTLKTMVRSDNKNVAYRARDALVSSGIIKYKQGKKGKASEYQLVDIGHKFDTENDTNNDTNPDTNSDTDSDTNSRTPNKTKTKTKNITTNQQTTRTRDDGLGRVMSAFLDKINPTPSQNSIDLLKGYCEEMGAEVCLAAIDKTLDAGPDKRNWNYIRGILRSLSQQGVKCLADWKKLEEVRKSGKNFASGSVGGYQKDSSDWNIRSALDD